jgi:hypothetical protein
MKWAIAVLCSFIWATSAMAQARDPSLCARLGHLARSIAQDRDNGVPYKDKLKKINEAAERAPNERAISLQLAKAIYDIPSMTPEGAYKHAYQPCSRGAM